MRPAHESPAPAHESSDLTEGGTVQGASNFSALEVEKARLAVDYLEGLRTDLRQPGERTGKYTESEAIARDLIVHMISSSSKTGALRRGLAEHMKNRIVTLRDDAEAAKKNK